MSAVQVSTQSWIQLGAAIQAIFDPMCTDKPSIMDGRVELVPRGVIGDELK
jgi:hypothetical protein